MMLRRACVLLAVSMLAACAGNPQKPAPTTGAANVPASHAVKRPARKPWKPLGPYTAGGLYAPGVADGAPDVPADVANLAEPVPHAEPLSRYGNRSPYVVLGKTYTVLPNAKGYDEHGVASWYGTKFDGRATSNFEPYDMYQFTAAHRTLPLPSYARVTNLDNGRSVIVRVNDRGPFHDGRLIDLSYAAAVKLGVTAHGTANVDVRGIDPGEPLPPAPDVARAPAANAHAAAAPKPASPPPRPAAIPVKAAAATAETTALVDDASKAAVVVEQLSAQSAPASPMPAAASSTTTAPSAANPAPSPSNGNPPAPATVTAAPIPVVAPPSTSSAAATPTVQPIVGRPVIDASTHGFLQVASYTNRANAEHMLQRLQQANVEHAELVSVQVAGQVLWRVHVGPVRADEAEAIADHLDALGFGRPPFFKD